MCVSYFKNPIFWSDILWFTPWSGFWSGSVLKPWNIGLVRLSVRITKNIINIRTGFNIVKNWSNSLMFRKTGPIRNTVVIFEFSFLKPSWDDSGRSLKGWKQTIPTKANDLWVKADDPGQSLTGNVTLTLIVPNPNYTLTQNSRNCKLPLNSLQP